MKRSKIGLIVVASLLLNAVLILQPIGKIKVSAAFPGYNGKIVFYSNRDSHNEIYTASADGSNVTKLTTLQASAREPRWSPDGSKIVFRSNHEGASGDIYTINADGSNLTRLTDSSGFDTGPSWDPAGNRIVFQSARDGGEYEVYIMNADGSNQTRLTNEPAYDGYASFTSDGNQILFRTTRDGGDGEIYRMNLDGSNPIRLTNSPELDSVPSMSPDGSKIVFQSLRDGNNEVYIMNADGSNQTRLTNEPGYDQWATFSPDGKYILFHSDRDDGEYHIYRMNIDGSNQTRLTEIGSGPINGQPDWQSVPNTSPSVAADSATTQINTSVLINVLTNDTDEETLNSSNLTVSIQPSHGSATIESGKVKYSPNSDYVGSDELTYQICDSFMLDQKCSTAVLSIIVKPAATIAKVGDKVVENGVEKVIASSNRPTFSGMATPGSTVKVEIHSDPIILTTTADSDGNWSVTPDQDLPAGDHTVKITATLNGVTTELDSFVLSVQQTIPNTGATSWPMRVGGGIAVTSGFSLAYWQRRRMRSLILYRVPQLFP